MVTAGDTTWYAFQDPKTGREYFHDPVSGKTSWVLPTSNSTTRIEKAESVMPGSTYTAKDSTAECDDTSIRPKQGETLSSHNKQSRRWSAVGVTIVSILIFNTMFLLVLVKVLYGNDSVPSQIHDQTKLPSGGGGVPFQAHEKNINIDLPIDDDVGTIEEEVTSEAEADPKSLLEEPPSLPNSGLNNETQSEDAKKKEAEDLNYSITEEPSSSTNSPEALSTNNNSPDDATELHDMPEPEAIQEEIMPSSSTSSPEALFTTNNSADDATELHDMPEPEAIQEEIMPSSSTSSPEALFTTNNSADDATELHDMPEPEAIEEEIISEDESKEERSHEAKEAVEKEELEEKEEAVGEQSNQIIDNKESNNDMREPGVSQSNCWIPFSFILVKDCRLRAREGLPMPLADAEKLDWI